MYIIYIYIYVIFEQKVFVARKLQQQDHGSPETLELIPYDDRILAPP